GLPVLLDAWRRVHAAVPDATLAVLGAQRDEEYPGVEFHGWVGDATKHAELAAASVFCAPNLGGESFGIIVAEAMAAGCAIVASSIPAFEHVAGSDARFAEPGDADQLAEALIELLIDPVAITDLGAAAIERVQQFDGRAVTAAYLQAYEDALASV
ncbi:MAG: glycosyltransferase family 4 protein, partial [Actinomycetota bacterium]